MIELLTTLLGAALALAIVWTLGYVLVRLAAPGAFEPRAVAALVTLLVGICAAGILPMVTGRLAGSGPWLDRAVTWTIPLCILAGAAALAARRRVRLHALLVRWTQRFRVAVARMRVGETPSIAPLLAVTRRALAADASKARLLRGARALGPWSSALALVIAAAVIVSHHPNQGSTTQMYGARHGAHIGVTVTSGIGASNLALLLSSGPTTRVVLLAAHRSPSTTLTMATPPGVQCRIDLYRVRAGHIVGQPIARLSFPAMRGRHE
jgi:hypothetical protein